VSEDCSLVGGNECWREYPKNVSGMGISTLREHKGNPEDGLFLHGANRAGRR